MSNTFADRLKETIKYNHVSQTAIAKELGTTQQSVSNWVNGVFEPSFAQFVQLCKILDVTPNYLLGYSDYEI